MTCTSVIRFLPQAIAGTWPPLARCVAFRSEGLAARECESLRGCGRGQRCTRELRPDTRSARDDLLESPAFAERPHEVQAESAATLHIRGVRGDHPTAAGILGLETDRRAHELDADDQDSGGGRAAVAHAVAHQL